MNRVVKLGVAEADEEVARLAGQLRYATGLTDATLDALVAATAAVHGGRRLVAIDPDVERLADHADVNIRGLPER